MNVQASESTFERELREFKDGLTDKQRHKFERTSSHDLKTFLAVAQTKQKSERKLRNMNKLTGFLEAV
jgi:hypothetical protein